MDKRIPKFLTEAQIEELGIGCRIPLEHALYTLLYSTGCRIGEVYKINKSDIDWNRNAIVVFGKGRKEREVYFNTRCSIWLKKYLNNRTDNCEALFITERKHNGEYHRSSIAQLRYVIKRIAKRSDVGTNVFPHKFRHSTATRLLDHGADLEFVRQILGHERTDTTRLYCQLSGERRREMYKKYF